MSTILKALENSKNNSQPRMMEQSSDTSWKIIAVSALLLIVILLAAVSFLLLNPSKSPLIAPLSVSVAPLTPTKHTPVMNTSSSIDDYIEYESQEEEQLSLVSEVNFKTKPLPLVNNNTEASQQWISAEKPASNKSITTSPKPDMVDKRVIKNESEFNDLTLEGVSKDLQKRFAMAVEFEDKKEIHSFTQEETPIVGASDISSMPVAFQFQVPDMRYDSHMYSTDVVDRWIRINGTDLRVGDYIGSIELLEIMPQQSLFRLNNQHFTLESLQDWEG